MKSKMKSKTALKDNSQKVIIKNNMDELAGKSGTKKKANASPVIKKDTKVKDKGKDKKKK